MVINQDGQQLGVIATSEGMRLAKEAGLDLVEVAPNSRPPVCRIMDYSRYKYDQEKKERQARKKQVIVHLKEIKMKPKIGEHDYQTKLRHLKRFLERKDKAKVSMIFRGREMTHMELGRNILNRLVKDLSDIAEIEKQPLLEGRVITMVLAPKK